MKKWLRNIITLVSIATVLVALVFVVLNWPSFWKRINFWREGNVQENNENVLAADNQTSIPGQDSIIAENELFPDLFVRDDIIQLKQEYRGKYPNNYLVIPSLQIAAPIVYLDDASEPVLQQKLKEGVGHYPLTALPGEVGNVFIFGHSSYYWWDWSEYNSVFANLESIGDQAKILVFYDDNIYVYQVEITKVVGPDEVSVLAQGEERELSLMTCTPLGTNLNRFVVTAKLVS
ncbi:MAG: sortase [Patescibacteria group bacterium]